MAFLSGDIKAYSWRSTVFEHRIYKLTVNILREKLDADQCWFQAHLTCTKHTVFLFRILRNLKHCDENYWRQWKKNSWFTQSLPWSQREKYLRWPLSDNTSMCSVVVDTSISRIWCSNHSGFWKRATKRLMHGRALGYSRVYLFLLPSENLYFFQTQNTYFLMSQKILCRETLICAHLSTIKIWKINLCNISPN